MENKPPFHLTLRRFAVTKGAALDRSFLSKPQPIIAIKGGSREMYTVTIRVNAGVPVPVAGDGNPNTFLIVRGPDGVSHGYRLHPAVESGAQSPGAI